MAQKLTKVAETTTLANTDTLIVVDESAQNTDGSTGALKRIQKSNAGFAFPGDITSAINTEVSNRNTAITNAINTEVSNRNTAIDEALSTKADAIVKSASGEVASFTDGGNGLLVKSLKVNIVPKQSGSGDPSPSNVRPISGTDSVNVNRTGKNLFHNVATSTTQHGTTFTKNADGSITVSGTPSAKATILISDGYVSNNPAIFSYGIPMPSGTRIYAKSVYNGATTYPTLSSNSNPYISLTGNGEDLQTMALEINTSFSGTPFTIYPMIELGNTPTEYEPYEGESKSISLGQTVYGGTLEVMSGKLTIDRVATTVNGDNNWWIQNGAFVTDDGTQNILRVDTVDPTNMIVISNQYKAQGVNYRDAVKDKGIIKVVAQNSQIAVKDTTYSTVAEFKTHLNSVPLQVVYKIATPTEITLTPTQVNTLLGNNNIWSDSGTVEVEYRADTTLAYNELLSLIASLS